VGIRIGPGVVERKTGERDGLLFTVLCLWKGNNMYKKIMVPVDGSDLAECVLPHVETIASATRATVELVRVVEPLQVPTKGGIALTVEDIAQIEKETTAEARKYLEDLASMLRDKGLKVETRLISGKVAESLTDDALNINADLIVMATHGRSGVSRWVWGSVADRILHASRVPVLLVRAPGCVPVP